MSTKSTIQNLQDSQLIRIFLDFVQCFHLQYQKIEKQISYKCHQATWILASTKATGYGRTQPQAYKHALRNLLQILIEDQKYTEFFNNILTSVQHNKNVPLLLSAMNPHPLYSNTPNHYNNYSNFNKQFQCLTNPPPHSSHTLPTTTSSNKNKSTIINKPPSYTHQSSNLTSNSNNTTTYNTQNKQFKTQSDNRQHEQQLNHPPLNNCNNNHDFFYHNTPSHHNISQCNNKMSKYQLTQQNTINNKILNPPINPLNTINSVNGTQMHHHQQPHNYTYKKTKNSIISSITSSTNAHLTHEEIINNSINSNKKVIGLAFNKNFTYEQHQQHYQNQGIAEQSYPSSNTSLQRTSHKRISHVNDQQNYDDEIRQAKTKYNKLKGQLSTLTDQNIILREQIDLIIEKLVNTKKPKQPRLSTDGCISTNTTNPNPNQQNTNLKSTNNYINTNPTNNVSNIRQTITKDITNTHFNTSNHTHPDVNTSIGNEEQFHNQTDSKLTATILQNSYSKSNDENINSRPSISSHTSTTHSNQMYTQDTTTTIQNNKDNNKSKVMVPKLKLQILPNYHKKIQKSLNDSLLAVYQQKHGHLRQTSNNNGQCYQASNEDAANLKSFINANQNQVKKGM